MREKNGEQKNKDLCTHHPGLVEEVVGGAERVERGDAPVLEAQQQVAPVLVSVAHVLANQQEVGLERPASRTGRNHSVTQSSHSAVDGWVGGWVGGWMGGWMDGWMHRSRDGWMD